MSDAAATAKSVSHTRALVVTGSVARLACHKATSAVCSVHPQATTQTTSVHDAKSVVGLTGPPVTVCDAAVHVGLRSVSGVMS